MTLNAPRRPPLRLRGFDYSDPTQVFSITVRARRDEEKFPFSNSDLASAVVSSLFHLRDSKGVGLYCYCLMPDHLHILLSPSERSGSLIQIMRAFKSYTARTAWSFGRSGGLWMRSFYDRAIRDEEDCRTTCEHILGNPVRAGLVKEPNDYPYAALVDPLPS